jgi:hypothetical protein
VGLERGPLSLESTTEELLGRNSSGSGLENREYGSGDPLHWPRDTLYPQKLALTSPTCGGRLVGIIRLRTKTTESSVNGGVMITCCSAYRSDPRSFEVIDSKPVTFEVQCIWIILWYQVNMW